jgi:hypothetical protein
MPTTLAHADRRRTPRDHDRLQAAARRYELACLEKTLAKDALVALLKELETEPEQREARRHLPCAPGADVSDADTSRRD